MTSRIIVSSRPLLGVRLLRLFFFFHFTICQLFMPIIAFLSQSLVLWVNCATKNIHTTCALSSAFVNVDTRKHRSTHGLPNNSLEKQIEFHNPSIYSLSIYLSFAFGNVIIDIFVNNLVLDKTNVLSSFDSLLIDICC